MSANSWPDVGAETAEAAARWVVRLASGEASAADIANFKAWVAADPVHQDAFDHARKMWAGLQPLEQQARRTVGQQIKRVAATLTALAASVAFIGFIAQWSSHDLNAPIGEVLVTTLPDGSRIWLDSGAAVDFDEQEASRVLQVARGRIHVSIAHDERRSFVVETEDAVIRDIGTAFSVDVEGHGFRVAVTEGEVEVDTRHLKSTLAAGQSAVFAAGRSIEMSPFDAAGESAWRGRRLVLENTPLADTLRQIERYRRGRIVLLDDAIGGQPISGAIALDDLDSSLDAIAVGAQLRLIRLPFLLIVTAAE